MSSDRPDATSRDASTNASPSSALPVARNRPFAFFGKRTAGEWGEIILRLILGGVFIYAGLLKLGEPRDFARIIGDYGLAPKPLLLPLAVLLPLLEIVGGVGLVFGRFWGLGLVTGLDLLFIGVLAYGLHLGLDIDCGCFGPEEPEARYHGTMRQALWRDVAMFGSALILFWKHRVRRRAGTRPTPLATASTD